MSRRFNSRSGRRVLFVVVVLAITVSVFLLPVRDAGAAKGLFSSIQDHKEALPNYDIRNDKFAVVTIAAYRGLANRRGVDIADARDAMVRGEGSLKQRVPTLKIEYNNDLKIPEVIAPDVKQGKAFLTRASKTKRSDILKSFLNENADLVGARFSQIDDLKVFSDYTNPDGKLSFVELEQEVNGIPVFRGSIKAGFSPTGEIIRVINNFAPGLDGSSLPADFGDPADAVRAGALHIKNRLAAAALQKDQRSSTDLKAVFGNGDFAPTAEKIYFPTEPGVAVAAWRVLIWQRVNAFYIIVDARTGTMLWRKNITEDQTQPATYNVYANPTAMVNLADSPFPMTPGTAVPNGAQGAAIPRTLVSRVGNEPPYTFNNLGWITDGNNKTDGNNVEAGLDRELPNDEFSPDDIDPNGVPSGGPDRVFDFPIDPAIPTSPARSTGGSPLPVGQSPLDCQGAGTATEPTDFQKAATTQLFYIANVYHDEVYRLGFTEAARNFQNDNFGRGGLGGDRISAQAQDCGSTNNANFGTPADGTRPTMQMYLWSGPTPDIDGSLDSSVVIHELTHGLSNRLHGNGTGLMLDIARGMGEGWSDFFAQCLLSEPTDPAGGIYPVGSYASYLLGNVGLFNYYYGIRRFPMAIWTSVGGLGQRPHNPLTFADIDSARIYVNDGAFSPRFSVTADEVHAIGEVWSVALWEIRARMISRLGWEAGNRRVLQIVTDGMKLAPFGPTPISERDAIVAGVFASGNEADLVDVWAGFASRGLGYSAAVNYVGGFSDGGTGTVSVIESFDPPNVIQTPVMTVSDAVVGNNNGYPEPGELVELTIPLKNVSGIAATGVTIHIGGGSTVNYGTMPGISTATQTMTYRIPEQQTCGSIARVQLNISSSLGGTSLYAPILIGRAGGITSSQNFDDVQAPGIPRNWDSFADRGGLRFVTSDLTSPAPDTEPNVMYARDPTTNGGGAYLSAPYISVTSPEATVTFRNSFDTEEDWDGGVLEIAIAGGDFEDLLTAGGTFTQNGYNGLILGGINNALAGRLGWTGNSNGYVTTVARLPANTNGKIIQLRWRFGADDNTAGVGPDPGWRIDSVALSGAGFVSGFSCSLTAIPVTISGRVVGSSGQPIRSAIVTLTNAYGFQRRATTSSFGVYLFSDVETEQYYTVGVSSKRYRFSTRDTNRLTGALSDFNFYGLE